MPEWLKSSNQPVMSTMYGRWKANCGVCAFSDSIAVADEPGRSLPLYVPGRVVTSRTPKIDSDSS